MTNTSTAGVDHVLDFWYADTIDHPTRIGARMPFWFQPDEQRDAEIVARFTDRVNAARAGELQDWQQTPRGQLALILLLDQMPRNIYRGTAEAFASDESALALCMQGIANGTERELGPAECLFYYMPLQHAESLEAQEHSVKVYDALAESVAPELADIFAGCADYARRHHDIIARFGRFPHRNTILGRSSAPEELAFLEGGGDTFGQA